MIKHSRPSTELAHAQHAAREAFVQGFVAARAPTTAAATLAILPEAEAALAEFRARRDGAK